ncbi:MAG TPA: Fe-S-containing protein [Blastocatellia bacterium]|nr:Fe-S-containing protein [Blastocatellia bacterium]
MFESLVVTLREGVEAALIVAIVIAYLSKIDRAELARSAYAGLAAAVAVSIIGALFIRRLEVNQESFEGWMMLTSSAFIATLVIWMWRTARRLKGEIETRMGRLAGSAAAGSFSFGIFTFVFLMVVREGIETVLLLSAVGFNSSGMLSAIGAATGLSGAVVFGVLFVKGSFRIDLRKFFAVTSVILLVVSFQLLVSGLHELSEAMILPSSAREMAVIGPMVKNDIFFYLVILTLAVLLIAWRRRTAAELPAGANPAEQRKHLHRVRRERTWARALAGLALVSMVAITGQFVYSARAGQLSPPEDHFQSGSEVHIPLARVNDGNLHRFAYHASDRLVRFIIVRLDSGELGVAFDSCAICGDKGYFQQGRDIICKNCTAAINPASIGQSGGCNPIELKSRVEASEVIILASDLDAGAQFFTVASSP